MSFQIFDWLERIDGKPDLGIPGVRMADARQFFDKDTDTGLYSQDVNQGKTTAYAKELATQPSMLTVVDIEHLPIYSQDVDARYEALDKIGLVVDLLHQYAPGLRVGDYSTVVERSWWHPVNYRAAQRRLKDKDMPDWLRTVWEGKLAAATIDYKAWQDRCRDRQWADAKRRNREGLADKIDCTCPSLYTFYDSAKPHTAFRWYMESNIAEARKAGKQCIPFVWFTYHGSGGITGDLDAEFVRFQLDTVRELADGVVLWNYGGLPWAERPWADTVLEFIAEVRGGSDL